MRDFTRPSDLRRTPGIAARDELHIGLMWHSCFSENLGVGALTVANAMLIGEAAERAGYQPVFHVMGVRGAFDYSDEIPYPTTFENIGYKALANPFSNLHRAIRRCDILFDIGGGDSFSDLYAARRYRLIVGSKFATAMHARPLILSPQTIGPFFTRRARLAAKAAMRGAERVFARDEPSFGLLEQMGLAHKSALASDVAFALPYQQPKPRVGADRSAKLKFGLNVSALLYRRDLASGDRIALALDYRAFVDALIDRLVRDETIECHLVPHVLAAATPFEDDYALARELAQRDARIVLAPRFTGPREAKSYIATLDLFAGSRMHATIAAMSSGVGVVPLGYSRKFNGLFDSLGYGYTVDLTRSSAREAFDAIEAALAAPGALREEAREANHRAHERLENYRGFLGELFDRFAVRHG